MWELHQQRAAVTQSQRPIRQVDFRVIDAYLIRQFESDFRYFQRRRLGEPLKCRLDTGAPGAVDAPAIQVRSRYDSPNAGIDKRPERLESCFDRWCSVVYAWNQVTMEVDQIGDVDQNTPPSAGPATP